MHYGGHRKYIGRFVAYSRVHSHATCGQIAWSDLLISSLLFWNYSPTGMAPKLLTEALSASPLSDLRRGPGALS